MNGFKRDRSTSNKEKRAKELRIQRTSHLVNENSGYGARLLNAMLTVSPYHTDLLEKSRVIRQAPGERCYHIYYQLFSGHKPELKKQLLLDKTPKDYWFISQAETTIAGVDDKEEFAMTDVRDSFEQKNSNLIREQMSTNGSEITICIRYKCKLEKLLKASICSNAFFPCK